MLVNIFCRVLQISLMSLTIIVPILLIKKLLKEKLSPRWHYYIWLFLIIRLLIPYTPEITLNNIFHNQTTNLHSISPLGGNTLNSSNKSVESSKPSDYISNYLSTTSPLDSTPTSQNQLDFPQKNDVIDISFLVSDIASKVWLIGILILLLHFSIVNSVMVYKINKTCLSAQDERIDDIVSDCKKTLNIKSNIPIIYQQFVKTPAIYGVINPKLLLPCNIFDQLTAEEVRYVIMHEFSHVKRRDTLTGICQLLLCIIHWFNPLIWYASRRISSDREPLCDYLVLKNVGPSERKNYAETLVKSLLYFSSNHWLYNTSNISQGSTKNMEWRLRLMNTFKKRSKILGLTAGVVAVFLGITGIILINKNFKFDFPVNISQAATTSSAENSIDKAAPSVEEVSAENEKIVDRNGKEIDIGYINQAVKDYLHNNKTAMQTGTKIQLTLDSQIQNIVDKQLDMAVKNYNVTNGACAIIINPRNGEVLAMVSKPAQTPASSEKSSDKSLTNSSAKSSAAIRGISEAFEPGSSIMPLIACAALEEGKISADSMVTDSPSNISGFKINCWRGNKGHGKETFSDAVKNSCNPIFADLAQKLGSDKFYSYLKNFGLNEKTGIQLNGEESSLFVKKPSKVEMIAASLGQRFKITPLQLLSAYGTIANDGILLKPLIIAGTDQKNTQKAVVSKETSNTMKKLLELKVSDGTAKNAYVSGSRIAGSTSTIPNIKGFSTTSFVGFAPADNPKFACIVVLDGPDENKVQPSGAMTASPLAAKIFKEVSQYINN